MSRTAAGTRRRTNGTGNRSRLPHTQGGKYFSTHRILYQNYAFTTMHGQGQPVNLKHAPDMAGKTRSQPDSGTSPAHTARTTTARSGCPHCRPDTPDTQSRHLRSTQTQPEQATAESSPETHTPELQRTHRARQTLRLPSLLLVLTRPSQRARHRPRRTRKRPSYTRRTLY